MADVIAPELTTVDAPPTDTTAEVVDDELLEDDLLVEDVSIDGMCGVY